MRIVVNYFHYQLDDETERDFNQPTNQYCKTLLVAGLIKTEISTKNACQWQDTS